MADDATSAAAGPLVSCVMLTRDRGALVPLAISSFLAQDYGARELLVLDDGRDPVADLVPDDARITYHRLSRPMALGRKRNLGCELARGPIVAHWDDDDWYAPTRLSAQIAGLLAGAGLSGVARALYLELRTGRGWEFQCPRGAGPWLSGATLCFRRDLWRRRPFADVASGEDTIFARDHAGAAVHVVDDPRMCVHGLHAANAAPKVVGSPGWTAYPGAPLVDLLGPDTEGYRLWATGRSSSDGLRPRPLVSCIMPTRDRRAFVAQAVHYFLAQDYPAKELIVVDDGVDPVGDLLPADDRIRYVRLHGHRSIGVKRNVACQQARGELIVQWDDDDWHGPHRVSHQVGPLIAGEADITGLDIPVFYEAVSNRFWACDVPDDYVLFRNISGGTVAFRRRTWARSGGYPDVSIGEDVLFVRAATQRGARLLALPNRGTFMCVRHPGNTWRFDGGDMRLLEGWRAVATPAFLGPEHLSFYRALSPRAAPVAAALPGR